MGFDNKINQMKNIITSEIEDTEKKAPERKKNWRKSTSITMDREIFLAIEQEASKHNISISRYIENHFKEKFKI